MDFQSYHFFFLVGIMIASFWAFRRLKWPRSPQAIPTGVTNVGHKEALQLLLNDPSLTPVDVRSPAAFEKEHIPGAVSALFKLDSWEINRENLSELDLSAPILVYCDGGYRSRRALQPILEVGFDKIYHLKHGLIHWKLFDGPTVRPSRERISNSRG